MKKYSLFFHPYLKINIKKEFSSKKRKKSKNLYHLTNLFPKRVKSETLYSLLKRYKAQMSTFYSLKVHIYETRVTFFHEFIYRQSEEFVWRYRHCYLFSSIGYLWYLQWNEKSRTVKFPRRGNGGQKCLPINWTVDNFTKLTYVFPVYWFFSHADKKIQVWLKENIYLIQGTCKSS